MLRILIKNAYQVLVSFYGVSIKMASHINAKAKDWNNGRKGQWGVLESWDNKHQKENRIWMHCASSGEFLQGKPILKKYKAANKEILIIVSFFSPSGYNQFRNDAVADLIFYLPLDTRSNAQRLLNTINPSLVLFIKNEFWFNILDAINKSGIPLFFISSVISRKDHIFLPFLIDVMKNVNHIFVQDKASLNNLRENGFINTSLSGDSRIDNVQYSKVEATDFPNLLLLKNKYSNCIVYGSIWKEDLKSLYPFINQRTDLLHIIAPHEVGKENIEKCCNLIKRSFSLYSNLEKETENNIIIVDSIGQLKDMYSLADIAYIGGGFGKGNPQYPGACILSYSCNIWPQV